MAKPLTAQNEIEKLALEVSEPVHQMASRLTKQIIMTVHETHIQPLRMAIVSAIHELNYHNIEQAKNILRDAIRAP